MDSVVLMSKIHFLFCLLFSVGVIFLIVWAVKTMPAKILKKLGICFIVVGIVGAILLGTNSTKYPKLGRKNKPEVYNFYQGMVEKLAERGLTVTEDEVEEMVLDVKNRTMK